MFRVIYANMRTRLVIIRCRHGPHKLLASALPFVTKVRSQHILMLSRVSPVQIRNDAVIGKLLYTGATIRYCYVFMLKRQRRLLERANREVKQSKGEQEELSSDILSIKQIDPF